MLQSFWQKLTVPRAVNEDDRLREHMTRVILVLSFISLAIFTGIIVIGWLREQFPAYPIFMMLAMDAVIGGGLWLAIRGHWRWASAIPPVAFFILAAYGSYTAGLVTTTVLLYILAILLTAMLRGSREQMLMVMLSALTHIGMGWGQGGLDAEDRISASITVTGSFLGVALLQWFFATQLKHALASARAYAAVLKEYRDHLEELVRNRTSALGKANEELQREIQERQQAQQALKQAHDELELRVEERTAELSIMLEAARAVSSTLDLEGILSLIAKQMVMAINASACTILRLDPANDTLVSWATWSRQTIEASQLTKSGFPVDRFLAIQTAIATKQPQTLHRRNGTDSPAATSLLDIFAAQSLLVLPLASGGQISGLVLLVETQADRQFQQSEIHLCQALTDQAAVTIENAYLHAETKKRSQRLAALHNIDMAITSSLDLKFTLNVLLEQVLIQLGVDAAAISINQFQTLKWITGRGFRSMDMEHTRIRMNEDLAGRAALERRLIHIPDLTNFKGNSPRLASLLEEEFITYLASPLIAKGDLMGVLEIFHRRPLEPDPDWLDFTETLAGQAAIAIHNSERLENLDIARTELELAYGSTLEAWVNSLYQREGQSAQQTQRLVEKTLQVARALEVPGSQLSAIAQGALLHDVGTIAVPEPILMKCEPLTTEDWEIIRQHPQTAFEILSNIQFLSQALEIPYCHHERWDGSGYPRGLKGIEIPLSARIFAVVDVWEALCSDRPYRQAWAQQKAIRFLKEHAGVLFDPQVVDAFLNLMVQPHDLVLHSADEESPS